MKRKYVILGLLVLVIVTGICFYFLRPYNAALIEDPDQSQLPMILQGSQNAARSIKSGSGKVVVHRSLWQESGQRIETETTYTVAYADGRFKVNVEEKYLANDLPVPAGEATKSIKPGSTKSRLMYYDGEKLTLYWPDKRSAVIADSTTASGGLIAQTIAELGLGMNGIYGNGVFDLTLTSATRADFAEIQRRIIGRQVIDGDECHVLEIAEQGKLSTGATATYTRLFWVNPARGYTVPRSQVWAEGGTFPQKTLISEVNTEVRDYGGGVWAPKKVVVEEYRLRSDRTRTYREMLTTKTINTTYTVNAPTDARDLEISLPKGTIVYDEIRDARYIVE